MSHVEHICVRCANCQQTCCQREEVYTSPGDVARIRAHTRRDDFTTFVAPEPDSYHTRIDDDTLWRQCVYRADGTRRILVRRPSGDCTFLGEQGCVLPLDVRPLVCRLYPFDYNYQGFRDTLIHDCPVHLLLPEETLLGALGMNRDDAEPWRALLYIEIQQEPHLTSQPCTSD